MLSEDEKREIIDQLDYLKFLVTHCDDLKYYVSTIGDDVPDDFKGLANDTGVDFTTEKGRSWHSAAFCINLKVKHKKFKKLMLDRVS